MYENSTSFSVVNRHEVLCLSGTEGGFRSGLRKRSILTGDHSAKIAPGNSKAKFVSHPIARSNAASSWRALHVAITLTLPQ